MMCRCVGLLLNHAYFTVHTKSGWLSGFSNVLSFSHFWRNLLFIFTFHKTAREKNYSNCTTKMILPGSPLHARTTRDRNKVWHTENTCTATTSQSSSFTLLRADWLRIQIVHLLPLNDTSACVEQGSQYTHRRLNRLRPIAALQPLLRNTLAVVVERRVDSEIDMYCALLLMQCKLEHRMWTAEIERAASWASVWWFYRSY